MKPQKSPLFSLLFFFYKKKTKWRGEADQASYLGWPSPPTTPETAHGLPHLLPRTLTHARGKSRDRESATVSAIGAPPLHFSPYKERRGRAALTLDPLLSSSPPPALSLSPCSPSSSLNQTGREQSHATVASKL